MTQWLENPTGGRDRGLRGLGRAWVEVLVRPGRFFRSGVAPGDQAPGLTFAMAVVLIEETIRLALVPDAVPNSLGSSPLAAVIVIGIAVMLVTPAALHLVAAIQTLLLIPTASDRGGTSETVQVFAYATAPCVLAGIPEPWLRVGCTAYGTVLLFIGLHERHSITVTRAAVVGTIPAAIAFGYGFRGFNAIATLLARWYII
ncbi:MAG: YIP1 family protein [Halobacteriales archaeon]|nr:YIP1 family protein [Halobacteriales archaeon]